MHNDHNFGWREYGECGSSTPPTEDRWVWLRRLVFWSVVLLVLACVVGVVVSWWVALFAAR